jgi:hypothetical protein
LNIICQAKSLDECKKLAEQYLETDLRIFQEDLSMFEQYSIRPLTRKYIPKIWKYKIVCKNNTYYFGKTMGGE